MHAVVCACTFCLVHNAGHGREAVDDGSDEFAVKKVSWFLTSLMLVFLSWQMKRC